MSAPKIGFLLASGLILALAGCAALRDRYPSTAEPAPPPVAAPQASVPGATRYALNAEASQILVYVYRAGRLAHLGHNHLISAEEFEGDLWLAKPLSDSRVQIRVSVRGLVVDDARLRAAAGSEFDTEPSPKDVQNTRRNLLGAQVLKAADYPLITLQGVPVEGKPPDLELDAELEIGGQTRRLRLPAHLESAPDQVLVSGEFRLRQSDFGITPYSVLMGALAVQDELRVVYRLVAEQQD